MARELAILRVLIRRAAWGAGVRVGRELRAALGPEPRADLAALLRPVVAGPAAPAGGERRDVYDGDGRLVGYAMVTPAGAEKGNR